MQCVLQCLLQSVLQSVLQHVLQCVLQGVAGCYSTCVLMMFVLITSLENGVPKSRWSSDSLHGGPIM